MSLNPHKATGAPAKFQTRVEAWETERAPNGAPLNEIVKEGDTFVHADMGEVKHKPAAVTGNDIRIVAGDHVGPWNRPEKQADMEAAWNEANPA